MLRLAPAAGEIEFVRLVLEAILNDEDEARGNIPDNLSETDSYCQSEAASEYISDALESLNEATSLINDQNKDGALAEISRAIELLENI